MVRACHMQRQPLQNHPSGHLERWATSWSAEEMLDGQRQRADISALARTGHNGLLQRRLEGDLCCVVPHVLSTDSVGQGTELNWFVAGITREKYSTPTSDLHRSKFGEDGVLFAYDIDNRESVLVFVGRKRSLSVIPITQTFRLSFRPVISTRTKFSFKKKKKKLHALSRLYMDGCWDSVGEVNQRHVH